MVIILIKIDLQTDKRIKQHMVIVLIKIYYQEDKRIKQLYRKFRHSLVFLNLWLFLSYYILVWHLSCSSMWLSVYLFDTHSLSIVIR